MNPKRSEIFENFAKIALEEGLISQAEAMTEDEKYRNSEYKDTIRALYNVKPNGEDDDILDKAHPEPVVVAPSYDKMNGVVENLKERQNVMVGVARKPNNGNLTQHKYAESKDNLFKQLISLGYLLDNKEIEELRVLADSCSERLVKNALAWWVIPAGVAAVAGIAAIINNTSPSDQGVLNNTERAIEWITEAKETMPQISSKLDTLLQDLMTLRSLVYEYNSLGSVDVSTPEKFVNVAQSQQDKFATVRKYKKACQIMAGRLTGYIDMLRTFTPQTTRMPFEWMEKLVDVYRWFDPDDSKEAALALETLQRSLIDSVKEASYFMQTAKQQEPTLVAVLDRHFSKEQAEPDMKQKSELDEMLA